MLVVALKRLLPVGLNLFAGKEQELVQHCKDKFLSSCEEEVLHCVLSQSRTDFLLTLFRISWSFVRTR